MAAYSWGKHNPEASLEGRAAASDDHTKLPRRVHERKDENLQSDRGGRAGHSHAGPHRSSRLSSTPSVHAHPERLERGPAALSGSIWTLSSVFEGVRPRTSAWSSGRPRPKDLSPTSCSGSSSLWELGSGSRSPRMPGSIWGLAGSAARRARGYPRNVWQQVLPRRLGRYEGQSETHARRGSPSGR